MSKNPFLNAFGAISYILLVVSFMTYVSETQKNKPDTFLSPILFLSLLTLSVAVMAYLFFNKPLQLFLESKKREAVKLFTQTVTVFAVITAFIALLVFSSDQLSKHKEPQTATSEKAAISPTPSPSLKSMEYIVEIDKNKFVLKKSKEQIGEYVYKQNITNVNLQIYDNEVFKIDDSIFFLVRQVPGGCMQASYTCRTWMQQVHDEFILYGGIWRVNISKNEYSHIFNIPDTKEAFPEIGLKMDKNKDLIFTLRTSFTEEKPVIDKTTSFRIETKDIMSSIE